MNIIRTLAQNYINFRGWSSKKKYVVIESDDWGSIRMPSKRVYDYLLDKGISVDKFYFTKYDCLENNDDVELLFDTLSSYKDHKGNSPVITALSIMGNPDFDSINLSKKVSFSFQNMSDTYNIYPNSDRVMDLWKNEGIEQNLLWPQFHGREHVNVRKWLRAINLNITNEDLAFDQKTILGIGNTGLTRTKLDYMAAFEYEDASHEKEIEEITRIGLGLFEKTFGFKSKSFAANGAIRGDHLDKVLSENGVVYHQLGQQFVPQLDGNLKKIDRYWGDKNKHGQLYWRRNATFEPSRNPSGDWTNKCMKDIEVAFRWEKPAVINSHRVNYSGGISTKNRDNTLLQLNELFKNILRKWPDVEFINSQQLGEIMTKEISKRVNVNSHN